MTNKLPLIVALPPIFTAPTTPRPPDTTNAPLPAPVLAVVLEIVVIPEIFVVFKLVRLLMLKVPELIFVEMMFDMVEKVVFKVLVLIFVANKEATV